jgi:hypothetical protein
MSRTFQTILKDLYTFQETTEDNTDFSDEPEPVLYSSDFAMPFYIKTTTR